MQDDSCANKKKVVRRALVVFMTVLIILTFSSKSIKNILLPVVECTYMISGTLDKGLYTLGTVSIENIEEINSKGNWTVASVPVEKNQEVKKGETLAVIDIVNVELNIKQAELELFEKENQLSDKQGELDLLNLNENDLELERLQSKLRKVKEDLDSVRMLYHKGAGTLKSVEDAEETVLVAEHDYSLKLLDIEEAKNKLESEKRAIGQLEKEVELLRMKYGKLCQSTPEDGIIAAPFDGYIKGIYIREGEELNPGDLVLEIGPLEKRMAVNWEAGREQGKRFSGSEEVRIVTNDTRGQMITERIDEKIWDTDKSVYRFKAGIDSNDLPVEENESVEVDIISRTSKYDKIIPQSCIFEEGILKYVYVLHERDGILGKEYILQKAFVEILDQDDYYAAVSSFLTHNDLIVSCSTKILNEGMEVMPVRDGESF